MSKGVKLYAPTKNLIFFTYIFFDFAVTCKNKMFAAIDFTAVRLNFAIFSYLIANHHPQLPGIPLKGPTISFVIQPP